MDICEKIAYIKGLAEGLALDETTKEGKILTAIVDLLDDMAVEICDIEDGCDELMEQIDAVDEDLSSVEDVIYGDDDDDCCDCCDCDDDECDDEDLYEIECPACHDSIYLDSEMLDEEGMTCPNCGTELQFDFDCDCDCDCNCDDNCDCGSDKED